MQDRIDGTGAQLVPMAAELFDHGQAIDRFLHGMVEHMKPDQARVVAPCGVISSRARGDKTPTQIAVETLRVIGTAMAEAGVVGLGRLTLSRRERMIMVEPSGTGMALLTLRAAEEMTDL